MKLLQNGVTLWFKGFNLRLMRWKDEDLLRLASQFSFLLGAGIPLSIAVELMIGRERQRMKRRLLQLQASLHQGFSLSSAFQKLAVPSFFSFCLRMAEVHGDYALAFSTLERYYQERISMREERKQLLRYPLILFTFIGLTLLLFLFFLLPRLATFYASFQIELPPLLQTIFHFTTWFQGKGWRYLFLFLVLITSGLLWFWRRKGQMRLPHWFHFSWFPLRSSLQVRFSLFFARTLSLLLQAGIPILQALREMISNCPSPWMVPLLKTIEGELLHGRRLAEVLEQYPYMTAEATFVVALAEEGGGVGERLQQYAQQLQARQKQVWEKRLQWLQPLLFLLLGALVLAMFSMLFQPMFGFLQHL